MALFGHDLGVTTDGWLAERIVLPVEALIAVPNGVSDGTAAPLAVVGGTVWHAMVAFGEAGPGKLVLTQGTGGVSLFALQLAKALGAAFAITSPSTAKLERARELGANYAIDYSTRPDWAPAPSSCASPGSGRAATSPVFWSRAGWPRRRRRR